MSKRSKSRFTVRKLGGWYLTVLAAALITHDAFGFGLFLLAVAACVLFVSIKVIR